MFSLPLTRTKKAASPETACMRHPQLLMDRRSSTISGRTLITSSISSNSSSGNVTITDNDHLFDIVALKYTYVDTSDRDVNITVPENEGTVKNEQATEGIENLKKTYEI